MPNTYLFQGTEVTGDPAFSMYNLSLKEEWLNNSKFCHGLQNENETMDTSEPRTPELTQQAQDRLDANKSRQSSPTNTNNTTTTSSSNTNGLKK